MTKYGDFNVEDQPYESLNLWGGSDVNQSKDEKCVSKNRNIVRERERERERERQRVRERD